MWFLRANNNAIVKYGSNLVHPKSLLLLAFFSLSITSAAVTLVEIVVPEGAWIAGRSALEAWSRDYPEEKILSDGGGYILCFPAPIGHKKNTTIMGPGSYKFGDYWRMGLPLEILVVLVRVPMILVVWPL